MYGQWAAWSRRRLRPCTLMSYAPRRLSRFIGDATGGRHRFRARKAQARLPCHPAGNRAHFLKRLPRRFRASVTSNESTGPSRARLAIPRTWDEPCAGHRTASDCVSPLPFCRNDTLGGEDGARRSELRRGHRARSCEDGDVTADLNRDQLIALMVAERDAELLGRGVVTFRRLEPSTR